MNIVPKNLKDGNNDALTTPLSVTGTAVDLDAELSATIVSFVGSPLQMKSSLEKAKAEMDAASKAAQAETRKGEDAVQDSAAKYGSHSVCSSRQAYRACEARTSEARKPIRYGDTGGYSHNSASRTGRRPWLC